MTVYTSWLRWREDGLWAFYSPVAVNSKEMDWADVSLALQTLGAQNRNWMFAIWNSKSGVDVSRRFLTLSHAEMRCPGRLPPKQENQTFQDSKDLQENGRNCILHTLHTFLMSVWTFLDILATQSLRENVQTQQITPTEKWLKFTNSLSVHLSLWY